MTNFETSLCLIYITVNQSNIFRQKKNIPHFDKWTKARENPPLPVFFLLIALTNPDGPY